MCLGDERIKKNEAVRNLGNNENNNTPSKHIKSFSASGSALRGTADSPYFYKGVQ
jgi:hypothetical protein